MEIISYKCPTCLALLTYNIENKTWKCNYCSKNYNLEELSEIYNKETIDVDEYVCSSCGAKIITDENTIATFCVYCGNTAIIKNRVTGVLKPNKLIPFKIDKKQVVEAFINCKIGKSFVPDSFAIKEQIEKIKGVYIPFWLHSGNVNGEIKFSATENWTEKRYKLIRAGHAIYKDLPTDASVYFDDTMMDGLEPFNFNELQDFDMKYLAGFFAEKYNVNKEALEERVKERVENGLIDYLKSNTGIYDSMIRNISDFLKTFTRRYQIERMYDKKIDFDISNSEYILLPVWLLNVDFGGNKYLFAMNGQTGKFIGDMPINDKKITKSLVCKISVTMIIIAILLFAFTYNKWWTPTIDWTMALIMVLIVLGSACYSLLRDSTIKNIKEKNSNMAHKNDIDYLYNPEITKSVDQEVGLFDLWSDN